MSSFPCNEQGLSRSETSRSETSRSETRPTKKLGDQNASRFGRLVHRQRTWLGSGSGEHKMNRIAGPKLNPFREDKPVQTRSIAPNPPSMLSRTAQGISLLTLTLLFSCSSKGKKSDENQGDKPTVVATAQAKDVALGEDSSVKDIQHLPKIELPWKSTLPEAIEESKQANKYVFIDFTASWCKACKELDMTTFRDPEVAALLKSDFILVKLDVTEQSADDKTLMEKYGVAKLPALLANQGEAVYLQINRLIGPRDLLSHLKNLPAIVPAATTD